MTFVEFATTRSPYIPDAFQKRVVSHVQMHSLLGKSWPLILIVAGPPGVGKTFMIKRACEVHNIHLKVMSASQLAGPNEGDVYKPLLNVYPHLPKQARLKGKSDCAILINDIDQSLVATKQNREYNQHSQLLTTFLMDLCDEPGRIPSREDLEAGRMAMPDDLEPVPIFLTANELTSIYGPLLRHGRVDRFNWKPSKTDVQRMVESLFEGFPQMLPRVLTFYFGNQSVAFYAAVRSELIRVQALKLFGMESVGAMDPEVRKQHVETLRTRLARTASFDAISAGRRLLKDREASNFLRK